MVAAGGPLAPEIAGNTAQAAIFVCKKPPRQRRIQTWSARESCSDRPDRNRISPISKKSGTATSTKLDEGAQITWPKNSQNGRSEKMKPDNSASAPSTTAI